jgi:hypothetical protein
MGKTFFNLKFKFEDTGGIFCSCTTDPDRRDFFDNNFTNQ